MNTFDLRIPRSPATDVPEPTTWIPAILENVESKIGAVLDKPARLEGALTALSPGQKALHAVWLYEMEINNGGHDQFFFNSAGALAEEALAGLRMFGADAFAQALASAVNAFPNQTVPRDREQRSELLESIDTQALESADAQFFHAYTGEESLARLARAYVDAHPDEFFV